MADEIIPTVEAASELVTVIVDETSPPENDAEVGAAVAAVDVEVKGNNNNRGKNKRDKKEQVPIEELYDLTKPIKRLERPSKESHEAEIDAIDSAIDALRSDRRALQTKIDAALGGGNNKHKNSPLGRERDALNKFKNRKGLMIEQKRQIRTRLEIVKANADRLIGQAKNARSGMKFTNVADIEGEIKRLQRRQETVSMSLADEKKLIKEIETLQASRRTAEELRSKQGDLDSIKEDRKSISSDLTAKDKEIDGIQKQIDAQAKVVKDLTEKQSTQRGAVDELIKQREDLKNQLDEKFREKNELRSAFRENTNEWYQNQRAVKAQRQLQYDEEKKRHEEEQAEWKKKKEEEEMAKIPFEEEMHLCDYLADYLTKAYLMSAQDEADKKAKAAEEKAKADVIAVKDDPFAGFKAMSKRDDQEVIYFGKGKKGSVKGGGEKKGKPKPKKASKPVAFSLNLDLFDQFGMLSLNPPTSLDAVSTAVDELKAKKQWYSEQPRGSVPTARDIRKANEVAANKASNSNGKSEKGGNRSGKSKGKFDISGDEFVPLGLGSSASGGANSNWGQKSDDGDAIEDA
mmetsp:Transcript_34301/g.61582  ORF Transcript_34301/g.61582 Transcript_34301/m.61582 type:complete len:574 (+) Transcript_34301:103-1824(+)|eukprot:CAMPEP_0201929208 /NCGR_PEP_ID=MMETSP0903-20130614/22485_1 /ASSEMBLY_ACC=CAM_ASM_000552 /TAXON_ID=420261 /ORGANISM="Thalassiosira antarctica, Strain CCMP982" /LENGTH=573 /DNA_ID=CAMNT_0048467913 /DNA_START=99 /DNA_END=1820 /DNA_ORIENTATION=+